MSERARVERTAAPLRQQVVKLLREDILNGALVSGQRLVEGALCESYGVSRTVIREALRQLESESLISVVPSRGPIVTELSLKDIESIYEVRARLEGLAGECFALHATREQCKALVDLLDRMEEEYMHGTVEQRESIKSEFYAVLAAGCGNKVLTEMLRSIHARIAIFRRFAFVDGGRVAHSMLELRKVVAAAAVARDPAMARIACEEHIKGAGKLAIMEYAKRYGHVMAQTGADAEPLMAQEAEH
jgi:DNA-binding GntR family transcriptional regulator